MKAALIAIIIAMFAPRFAFAEAPNPDAPVRTSVETVVGPATPIDDDPHSIPVYGTENPRQKAYPET